MKKVKGLQQFYNEDLIYFAKSFNRLVCFLLFFLYLSILFFAHVISQNYWNCLQYCCLPDGLVLIFELHNFGLAFVASGLSGLDLWIFFLQFCNHNWRLSKDFGEFCHLAIHYHGFETF